MLEVIFYSLIGGVVSLTGGAILLIKKRTAEGMAKYATPFAAGVLLAAAFTDLLPEALQSSDNNNQVLNFALYGMLVFFILEKFLNWFHHHHEHEDDNSAVNSLVIIGDTLHNAFDGIAIAAAFLISSQTGIVTTIAVAAHEIPQEIGDFGLMLKHGMRRSRVLLVNFISALATTVAAIITYSIGQNGDFSVSYALAITAGFFIYIAASDIIPEIHEKSEKGKTDLRPWLLLGGVAFILFVSPLVEHLFTV